MKVLFLCHKMPYPANDGGAIATLNMIEGFANLKAEVAVLAMQTPKHSYSINILPINLSSKIKWHQAYVNTKIRPLKALFNLLFSSKPYNAVRFESKKYKLNLINLLKTQQFDLIQLEGAYLTSYVKTIRKFSNAKISLRAHNIEYEIWQRLYNNEKVLPKKVYYKILTHRVKKLENELIRNIDLLVPITQRDAVVLMQDANVPVHVSPTGLKDEVFSKKQPKHEKTLFYIGALDWLPNQEALKWFIENVWHEISAEFTDWQFVVAGRNAPNYFSQYLQNKQVTFVGEVASATEFIDKYNIMMVPLLSGSGMRIKIIEGMARGKCILTTSIGAEGIGAENKKEIYIADDKENTIATLRKLIQNPEEINNCAENAFIFVKQNYNNNNIIMKLKDFYAKYLGIS